jgi:hypothetical protein
MRSLVLRGVGVGALAGLVAFVFGWIFGEPLIQAAIDYEGAREGARQALDAAAGLPVPAAEADLVSRGIQGTVGIGLGMLAFGVAMGALLAVAYALAWGRVGVTRPRALAVLVAGAGFLTLYLVPFLKYPANPPAVGHDDTIGARTGLYLVAVVGSVLALLIAIEVGKRLSARFDPWNAVLLGGLTFVVLAGLLVAVLPALGQLQVNVDQYGAATVTETPGPLLDPSGRIVLAGFDPDLLYDFRVYSVLAQALLWTVIGLGFGALTERAADRTPERITAAA